MQLDNVERVPDEGFHISATASLIYVWRLCIDNLGSDVQSSKEIEVEGEMRSSPCLGSRRYVVPNRRITHQTSTSRRHLIPKRCLVFDI